MVETERPHRSSRRRSTSEFFLCFSSRSTAASSSSSMKISSKSILSPGRSRESSMSLSSSLSRRLRSNGSMKGGQASPMFPTGSKKKGSGGSFEPPEPSSPKVTCIGQVRVKSKKKHGRKQLRTRSERRGEVSFRKTEQTTQDGIGIHHQQPQPQQRWVHLSLSICETLRAFGAEFNCFVPCGRSSSSCSWSGDREKGGDKRRGGRSSNSCGAVFARWLFALQESEEKGREAVVPAREEEERIQIQIEIERREAAREIEMEVSEEEEEVKTTRGDAKEEEEEEIEEEGRQSICIPPKNALLLMRSRSAPFRMSSLANRFWESPAPQDKEDNYNKFEDDDEEEEIELEIHNYVSLNGEKQREAVTRETAEEDRNGTSSTSDCGNQTKLDAEETKEEEMVEKWSPCENLQESQIPSKEEEMLEPQGDEGGVVEQNPQIHRKDEVLDKGSSSPEAFEDSILKVEEEEEKTRVVVVVVEKKEERRVSFSSSTIYLEPESESEEDEEQEEIESSLEQIAEKSIEEEKENTTLETTNVSFQDPREQQEKPVLPECLLLMMCEPKLSMEVSKETWVCSNDFIRCRPSEKKKLVQKKIEQGEDAESKTKKTDTTSESKTVHPLPPQPRRHQHKKKDEFQVQPPRSSYSKVEQAMKKQSMATAVGQKLSGGGGAYEPFVLKRCKSEPMRRTDKLSGEVCLWKKNKMESHHPPELPVGAGATGVGF